MVTQVGVFFWYLKHPRVKMDFCFFLKIYSSHFENWTFLKCPFLKSDPISFYDFLGVPLIFSLNLYNSREPTVPSDTPSLIRCINYIIHHILSTTISLITFFIIFSLNFSISSSPLPPNATNANSVNFSFAGVLFSIQSGYFSCHCCI